MAYRDIQQPTCASLLYSEFLRSLLAEAMVGGRAAGSVSTPAEPYRAKSAGNRSIDGLAKWFLGFS
jgi:hypothetical protein